MTSRNDLSLRQLEYVVAVADTLGFHRAARQCHVSQPALSAQIQLVERVLGFALFERDRRSVRLTEPGQQVVRHARKVLTAVDDLLHAAEGFVDPYARTLRIGVIPTVAPYLLPEIVPQTAQHFARLDLRFTEAKTSDIREQLDAGALDAGLLALEADLGELAHAVLTTDDFVVALPKAHPLGKRKSVKLEELSGETVLLLDDGHCFRQNALDVCSRAGAVEATFRATSLATLAQMVALGRGITLLPEIAVPVENRRAQLDVRPLARPAAHRTLALVWRPGSPLAPLFEELAAFWRKALRRPRESARKSV